jgi:hypothetical protein
MMRAPTRWTRLSAIRHATYPYNVVRDPDAGMLRFELSDLLQSGRRITARLASMRRYTG